MTDHPASRKVIPIYERYAREWDADRDSAGWNDKRWHERFIGCLPRAARVLDLGCGSGNPVARHFVRHGLHVTGVDASPTLISLCRARMPEQEWIVADMRSVALERRFDGILAWDSYFFLTPDDQRRMFDVFARHAAAPCILMFNTGPRFGESIGEYRGEPLYHASLDATEYETLLERNGFRVLEHVVEDPKAGGRTAWLATT